MIGQQTIDATITHNGLTREYKVYVPSIYDGSTSVPLVFNLHGYTSNNQAQLAYADFRGIADTANFIIVLPQGTLDNQGQPFWNARYGESVDDLGFLSALIDTVSEDYNINQERIYSTGMSNGGFMSFTLACELSNRITAVASVTGSMSTIQPNYCSPNRAVPIMQIHGTSDATVNYNGGFSILSIDSVLNYWIANNNCSATPTTTNVPDVVTTDLCTATRYDYLNGDLGSSVVHYKINSGGHTWPGAPINIGVTNQDFDASVEIWKFFNQYQLSDFVSVPEIEKEETSIEFTCKNPFDDYLSFSVNLDTPYQVSITDILGKMVFQNNFINEQNTIDLQHLKSGIYLFSIDSGNQLTSKKIIKN